MTDDSLRQMLAQFSADLREGREYMQSLAHDVASVGGTCMRIEEKLAHLADRLAELRKDHDRVVVEITRTDQAMLRRISAIEKQAAWVRAWSAGAAAVVLAVGGALAWAIAKMPGIVTIVGGK